MDKLTVYIFRQLGLAALTIASVLTTVIWLTQALRYLDWTVNRGLPVGDFLAISALALPSFLSIILPVTVFSAVLFIYNNLQTASELVVMRAAGIGPFRLVRPALMVAAITMVLSLVLTVWAVPASYRAFKDMQYRIVSTAGGGLIEEGVFTHVGTGLTIFVRDQSPNGDLSGILVHDKRDPKQPEIIVAERARFVASPDGPRLLLIKGNRQEIKPGDLQPSFLYFERYALPVNAAASEAGGLRQRVATERYMSELLNPPDVTDPAIRVAYFAEANQRLASPFYVLSYCLIGLAFLLAGSFSRRGQTRLVLAAILTVGLVQAGAIALINIVARHEYLVPLVYADSMLPALIAGWILFAPNGLNRLADRARRIFAIGQRSF